ncbi:unnamed protein product [Danaus chrysippus]|uniref:TATA box-binding protein-like 1 n=33 Tax=Papilionoidea TaxID=37572 RepID=A0A8J2QPJ5_9NEOP|nr:unnamed protein product [Danaus chrysippus]CAG9566606.1 unnamed protein product [Danaus chrysippus]
MATLIQENGMKLSKGTHGVVVNHGMTTHGVPNHMVPDHEYCESGQTAQAAQQCPDTESDNHQPPAEEEEETPEIDIMINNVVCSFSVKCHLNLRQIALNGVNVEFRRENGMVTMKLRRPYTTASIWSSGRVTCTGATSEDQAKVAARRYARALQKLGFQVRFRNFRVVNVLGTCRMPFGIRIIAFSKKYKEADYEPELHPGVTYKLYNPKATLKIFSTGGVTITGIEMDIKNNTALIEALLLEELPDCDEASDAGVSDDEVENVQLPSPRGFDEIFERAIEDVLAEVPPSSPSNEDVLEYPINQVPTSSLPAPSVQPDLPSANNSSHRTNQRLPEPNRKWKKRDLSTSLPEYIADTGVVDDWFAHCTTPTDIFLVLIDDIVDNIVYQSNLYATQKSKVLNLKKEELLTFIGINFFMGYNTRPAWRDHYSSAPDLNNALICKTLPRDRFAIILSHLHCNDSSKMPSGCKDKLYKIRPMIDALNKKFEMVYHGTRELSVDESMIKFKGRSVLKQYLPMKPIKRGYKLWCLADQRGYIKKFQIYQGKDEELNTKFTGYGLGEKVVLELTEQDWSKGKVVYFDNFFTSVALLEKLKTENTYACGTIRSNRKGLPGNMLADSQLKRGDSDHRFSNLDIGYWKWKDNKMVHLVSNFHGNEEATVSRKEKNGTKSAITCPIAVKDYNMYMGGVDTADRLRALYCIDRKSPKWWHRLFWGLLDIVFVNAYVIHGLIMEQTTVKDFRRSVTQGLMTMKDASQKRKTSTDNTAKGGPSKRRKSDYSTIKDVRLARSVSDVQSAVERIFPLVYEFRKPHSPADEEKLRQRRAARSRAGPLPTEEKPLEQAAPQTDDPMHLVTLSDDDAWE